MRYMKKIYSEQYYSAFYRPRGNAGKCQLLIFRRDTREIEVAVTVASEQIKETATKLIVSMARPRDWKSPHRECLYYYLKIGRKRDGFGLKLIDGKFAPRDIMGGVKKFEAYTHCLLKKMHSLSDQERILLLTPSEKEYEPKTSEDVDLLQARDTLFGLFFEKTKEMSAVHFKTEQLINKLRQRNEG